MDLTQIKKDIEAEEQEDVKLDIREVEKKVDARIQELKPKDFAERIESFEVNYQDGKKIKKTTLQSKIMDADARSKYDRVLASLSEGVAFDNLPLETRNRYICLARLVCQVIKSPEWLLEKASEDIEFCFALGGKLVSHEQRYFRYYDAKDETTPSAPRFSIG